MEENKEIKNNEENLSPQPLKKLPGQERKMIIWLVLALLLLGFFIFLD